MEYLYELVARDQNPKRRAMKVIETYVAWSNRYQDYVMVYMCQSVDSQEIEYFAQDDGELWKPSELELKELLKQQ